VHRVKRHREGDVMMTMMMVMVMKRWMDAAAKLEMT
jgi:hypothetical protein